ncbi:MAG: FGGY-family carbohydrate kinase [Acidimicrobiales bacterium]
MADLVAGVDVATADVRVTVADASGRVRGRGRSPLPPPRQPHPGWSEQDAAEWWPAVAGALREATGALGDGARRIRAVAVAATSGTVVVVDAEARPLGPALLYDDRRAADEGRAAAAAGADRWEAGGWRPGAGSGVARWAWLLGRPGIVAGAWRVWHESDLVVHALTGGDPPTDWSHARKSGYDPAAGEWATEALAAVGIPQRLVPEVRPPTSPAGCVSQAASAATGLPAGCDVRLGMTDGCAAQVAAGADRPGRFVTVIGTTLVVKGATEDLVRDRAGAVYCHRHPDGWWLPGGASNTGGAALDGDADPGALDRAAADHGPAACATYPLVGTGERFPFEAADATEVWVGEPRSPTERHRAVLEGVAFAERLAYQRLAGLGAAPDGHVRSAGGGGRSRVWAAIRATALGRPVLVMDGADTASGACILAAAGTIHPDLAAASAAMVGDGEEVAPVDGERDALDVSFRRLVDRLAERGWVDDDLRPPAAARS